MDDLCRLLDYGKDVFERVATGFFVEIRAPPNPNNKKVFLILFKLIKFQGNFARQRKINNLFGSNYWCQLDGEAVFGFLKFF